eukprot:364199-Chlamydomonas_euryale.AAC.15
MLAVKRGSFRPRRTQVRQPGPQPRRPESKLAARHHKAAQQSKKYIGGIEMFFEARGKPAVHLELTWGVGERPVLGKFSLRGPTHTKHPYDTHKEALAAACWACRSGLVLGGTPSFSVAHALRQRLHSMAGLTVPKGSTDEVRLDLAEKRAANLFSVPKFHSARRDHADVLSYAQRN